MNHQFTISLNKLYILTDSTYPKPCYKYVTRMLSITTTVKYIREVSYSTLAALKKKNTLFHLHYYTRLFLRLFKENSLCLNSGVHKMSCWPYLPTNWLTLSLQLQYLWFLPWKLKNIFWIEVITREKVFAFKVSKWKPNMILFWFYVTLVKIIMLKSKPVALFHVCNV